MTNRDDIDVDLMRRTLVHITANKKNWDQYVWGKRGPGCDTSFCAGGWAVALSGLKIVWTPDGLAPEWEWGNWVEFEDGTSTDVRVAARHLLGLTSLQADEWFDTKRSLYNLWTLASKWTDGAIEVPDSVKPGWNAHGTITGRLPE